MRAKEMYCRPHLADRLCLAEQNSKLGNDKGAYLIDSKLGNDKGAHRVHSGPQRKVS